MIKSAINIFLVAAVVFSLFQELDFGSSAAPTSTDTPAPTVPEIPVNGTKVEGLIILSTDNFRRPFKELLIEKNYNL